MKVIVAQPAALVNKSYAKVLILKGCNSTGSIAMKIVAMQLIEFSEGIYGLSVSKFC
jgi:hypothetical protein